MAFVAITLEEMETFLRKAYRSLHPRRGQTHKEVYYDLNLGDRKVLIRVWTSIDPANGVAQEVGSDAIRVAMVTSGGSGLMPKATIVKRTNRWRGTLQDRIEEFLELYESKAEYWKGLQKKRDEGEAAAPKSEPRDKVEVAAPTQSGDAFEGGYRKLKNGDWGVQIWTRGSPGDEGIAKTHQGKKPTRVRLLRLDSSGPDRFKGNKYSEVWAFEEVNGTRGTDRFASDSVGRIAAAVAQRFSERVVV